MRDLKVVYEQVEMQSEEAQMRLDKAYDIIFSKLAKAADLGIQNPQNPIRAEAVSMND